MKNYTITVNGTVYQVTVEENAANAPAAPVSVPSPAAPAPVKQNVSSGSRGSVPIPSPMMGKILSVRIKPGDAVKKGQIIMILEAMKMENEIVAPEDGVVASVEVKEGTQLEAGDLLATLR